MYLKTSDIRKLLASLHGCEFTQFATDIASDYTSGVGLVELAAKTGSTASTMSRHLKEIGVSIRKRGRPKGQITQRTEQILMLAQGGLPLADIASIFGISRQAVSFSAVRHGISRLARRLEAASERRSRESAEQQARRDAKRANRAQKWRQVADAIMRDASDSEILSILCSKSDPKHFGQLLAKCRVRARADGVEIPTRFEARRALRTA
jgi:hypothetical protein